MALTRRQALGILAGGLTTGCLGDGSDNGPTLSPEPGNGNSTPTADGGTRIPSPTDCDPADVNRPPIIEDANHPPKGYGTKPTELTQQSVADYLADFETAYAWNRILAAHSPVTNLGVNTTTPWTPEPAGEGYLSSSRIETSYAKEATNTAISRTYVASYYVSTEPVYRAETDDDPVDPRTHPNRQLVQCGRDTKQ